VADDPRSVVAPRRRRAASLVALPSVLGFPESGGQPVQGEFAPAAGAVVVVDALEKDGERGWDDDDDCVDGWWSRIEQRRKKRSIEC
jgi:hypothetical protein